MPTDPEALADELMAAYAAKRTIAAVPSARDTGFNLTSGYAVEAAIARARRAAGHQTAGWKVGYVNRATWGALGLQAPLWAHMYDDTVRYADWNDAKLSIASMLSPKIEAEIVFRLARVPASSDPVAVLEATEWYALGFEIIDSVFPDATSTPADWVACRGMHTALIVGEPVYVEPDDIAGLATDLADFTVRLLRNNELVEEGAGKNVLESPALCVGELARAMSLAGGETLQPGDVVSTGSLARALPIAAGDTWIASLSGIPPSALTLRIS